MRKRIAFQDNMETLAADENAMQGFVQQWGEEVVTDFLQALGKRGYSGLKVTRKAATMVTVAVGRYYDGAGRMFGRDAALDIDLTPYLPAVGGRIVAIVCYGEEAPANQTFRNFVDPATEESVPRQVSLELHRELKLTVVAGTEAGTPVAPTISATYLGVALVRLTTTGAANQAAITQLDENEITSLADAITRVVDLESWRRTLSSTVTTLRSDIADLARQLKGVANTEAIRTISKEVARLREEMGLPDAFTASHSDAFLTADEAWTNHEEFQAKVEEGIRFANAGEAEAPIALLSSIDSAVTISPGGLMLPKYTEASTISIGNQRIERDAELPISQYQTATITGDVLTLSRLRQRYGEEFVVCSNARYWQTGEYDAVNGVFSKSGETWTVEDKSKASLNHQYVRTTRFFSDDWADPYWQFGATQKSVTGKILAQTRLATATRWITRYDLWFTQVAPTGDVTLLVCGVANGKPDLTQVYSHVTVPAATLKAGDWTQFPLEPFVMVKGYRYAIVVVTAGDHWLQISTNNDFTQGTLYTFVDGDYAIAMADRDMCFTEWAAKFSTTRTVVDLQPWSLSDGITGIDVLAPCWRSSAATLSWEFKVNNKWYVLGSVTGTTPFTGLPPMVQARLSMTHTNDIAPGIQLGTSRVRLTRPRTTGRYISKTWSLPAPATSVSLTVLLSSYDAAYHTITPKLRTNAGSGYSNIVEASSVSISVPRKDGLRVMTVLFDGLGNIPSYAWQLDFSTTSALKPLVIEEVSDAAL